MMKQQNKNIAKLSKYSQLRKIQINSQIYLLLNYWNVDHGKKLHHVW